MGGTAPPPSSSYWVIVSPVMLLPRRGASCSSAAAACGTVDAPTVEPSPAATPAAQASSPQPAPRREEAPFSALSDPPFRDSMQRGYLHANAFLGRDATAYLGGGGVGNLSLGERLRRGWLKHPLVASHRISLMRHPDGVALETLLADVSERCTAAAYRHGNGSEAHIEALWCRATVEFWLSREYSQRLSCEQLLQLLEMHRGAGDPATIEAREMLDALNARLAKRHRRRNLLIPCVLLLMVVTFWRAGGYLQDPTEHSHMRLGTLVVDGKDRAISRWR